MIAEFHKPLLIRKFINILLVLLPALTGSLANAQVYLDSTATIESRVEDLLGRMTLADKIGQMTQAERSSVAANPGKITSLRLGSVLSGGGSVPTPNTLEAWADMVDAFQDSAMQTPLKIPIIYGIDAVHGHNNLRNAVIFPHNIGMGCTRNPDLAEKCARITALEVNATGIDWTFGPCIAVPRDERWGRTYEGFGESPELAESFARAEVLGFQSDSLGRKNTIAACAKHYIADGGTAGGINEGNAQISEEELRKIHLPGYISAVNAGVATVMASFSQWNGSYCHGDSFLLTRLLKEELGFKGFIVSDWNGIDHLSQNYREAVKKAINAGIDMAMAPYNYASFITALTMLVDSGDVSMARIDDAVSRILRIKFQMGLFEHRYTDRSLFDSVGCVSHREVARQAVRESLVLLKNNGVLPLQKSGKKVIVIGSKANDIGVQCGGWTITWQGMQGDITEGTTILEAVKQVQGQSSVSYSTSVPAVTDADVGVVVVGENPYAESYGDDNNLALSLAEINLVKDLHNTGIPVVTILLSGRPMIINDILDYCDALVAAWLPGTEGQGIADVLYGDYDFKGKLSHSWPASMSQIPVNTGDLVYNPLFEYEYGLNYESSGFHSPDEITDQPVIVFPDPAREYIIIKNLYISNVNVNLINTSGSIVRNWRISHSNGSEKLFLNDLPHGIYFIKVSSDSKIIFGDKLLIY